MEWNEHSKQIKLNIEQVEQIANKLWRSEIE